MRIFISVISHLHHDIIINLGALKQLAKQAQIEIICRDNKPISKLKNYCRKYNIHYVANENSLGFSENNNANYCYAKQKLNLTTDDYFVLLNPDVFIKKAGVDAFIHTLTSKEIKLGVANLFLDREEIVHDDNIRLYPKLGHFITTYLFDDRSTMVNRNKKLALTENYWGSCAFMVVNSRVYEQLLGLDERYYMYCEDVDFCYRAKNSGIELTYLKEVHAVHFRRRNSKNCFTKYFLWHVISVMKYSLFKRKQLPKKSLLKLLNNKLND